MAPKVNRKSNAPLPDALPALAPLPSIHHTHKLGKETTLQNNKTRIMTPKKPTFFNTEIHSRQRLFSKVDRKALNIVCAAFTGLKHKSRIYTSSRVKETEWGGGACSMKQLFRLRRTTGHHIMYAARTLYIPHS